MLQNVTPENDLYELVLVNQITFGVVFSFLGNFTYYICKNYAFPIVFWMMFWQMCIVWTHVRISSVFFSIFSWITTNNHHKWRVDPPKSLSFNEISFLINGILGKWSTKTINERPFYVWINSLLSSFRWSIEITSHSGREEWLSECSYPWRLFILQSIKSVTCEIRDCFRYHLSQWGETYVYLFWWFLKLCLMLLNSPNHLCQLYRKQVHTFYVKRCGITEKLMSEQCIANLRIRGTNYSVSGAS